MKKYICNLQQYCFLYYQNRYTKTGNHNCRFIRTKRYTINKKHGKAQVKRKQQKKKNYRNPVTQIYRKWLIRSVFLPFCSGSTGLFFPDFVNPLLRESPRCQGIEIF